MKKRLLALLASACMLALMLPVGIIPAGAEGGLQQDVATFLENLIGSPAIEWSTGGSGTQCPELPSYYVQQCFDVTTKNKSYGNGNTYYSGISAKFPAYFTKIDYYDGFLPHVGDIVSFESSSSPNEGHVAVVYDVDYPNNEYSIVEQWKGSGTVKTNTKAIKGHQYAQSYTIIGVARPYKISFCSHTYDAYGNCTNCGYLYPYDMGFDAHFAGTYRVKSGQTAVLRTGPYSYCDDIASFTSGTFTVLGRVTNSVPNDWYQVNYNGQICYIYKERIEKITDAPSTLTISPSATTYTITQGKSCNIGGSITSNYPITSVQGYLDGSRYANFAPNTTSVNIGDYSTGKLNSFKAQDLPVGTHTIEITATDGHKTVSKTLYIVVNSATHTHSYTAYVETAHPHKVYMKCSCGDWYYTGETRKQDGCAECYPPVYYLDVNFYLDDEYTSQACGIVFDVYINESLEASSVSDFCRQYPAGTTYSISNIRASEGYVYGGNSSPLTGKIVSDNAYVILKSYHDADVWLDVNQYMDGKGLGYKDGLIFDVYINNSLVANSVSEFWQRVKPGSTYSITNVRANSGYVYGGPYNNCSLSGTITSSAVYAVLTSYHLPKKPQISVCSGSSEDNVYVFWNKTGYTDYYDLHLKEYSTSETTYSAYYNNTNSYYVLKLKPGKYEVTIFSCNMTLWQKGLSHCRSSNTVTFTVTEGTTAPVAETTYNGHRYELYDNGLTWSEAKAKCEALGGHLVTITSPEEEAAVEKLLAEGKITKYWLGCNDHEIEGTWKWITEEEFEYTNWHATQPDNTYDTITESFENYASINTYSDGIFWNDQPGIFYGYYNGFICEYEPIITGDLTGNASVDADDLTALAKIVAKIDGGSPAAILAADVTHDGKVDADDLTKIAKYVAKIIPNLD